MLYSVRTEASLHSAIPGIPSSLFQYSLRYSPTQVTGTYGGIGTENRQPSAARGTSLMSISCFPLWAGRHGTFILLQNIHAYLTFKLPLVLGSHGPSDLDMKSFISEFFLLYCNCLNLLNSHISRDKLYSKVPSPPLMPFFYCTA